MANATDPKDEHAIESGACVVVAAAASGSPAASSSGGPRRLYLAPKLRRLGSVRELTLGGTMGFTDGQLGRQTM